MNRDLVMNFFKGVALFNNLGPVLLTRLAESSGALRFTRGGTIVEEGGQPGSLYIVASGRLEVYRQIDENSRIILQTLFRGDLFGEQCVLEGSQTAAGLMAAEDSLVIIIDRQTLLSFIKDSPEFSRNYIKILSGRFRDAAAREKKLLSLLLASGLSIPEEYCLVDTGKKREETSLHISDLNQAGAPEDQEEDDGSAETFFKKEFSCPLCSTCFRTLKPRQKHIIVERADDDFCLYYKTVNPLYYEINVCPACGYSFNSSTSGAVKPELKKGLSKMLAERWKSSNFCGPRTLEDAVQTFILAIECQRLMGADDSVMGRLFLKLGWLHRYLNTKESERRCLDMALNHLSRHFNKSPSDEPREEMNLMFLLGQLHRILGDEKGAVGWFVKITQHPQRKAYPYLVNRARDAWQEIKKHQ